MNSIKCQKFKQKIKKNSLDPPHHLTCHGQAPSGDFFLFQNLLNNFIYFSLLLMKKIIKNNKYVVNQIKHHAAKLCLFIYV